MEKSMFNRAVKLFDEYNSHDPKSEKVNDSAIPANLLYSKRMNEKLIEYAPDASESLQLAARSQHIGRWEIPRNDFPMDRKGYLKWRSQLKLHHAQLAERILQKVGYEKETIVKVKDLLVKKQLKQNAETQTLEDVICLVFLEFYFDDFSEKHEEAKLVGILQKTMAKMSLSGIKAALHLPLSERAKELLGKASN